jgi:hypothetical protein
MRRRQLCTLLALAALGAGCDPAPDAADEVRERLVGSWLRDYEENGTRVRRVLVLEPDGRFRETSRSLGPQELGKRHMHEGEWLYDGTNLKRRYTLMDGQPVAAPQMPFAAFQIRFTGSHEFIGVDNVRKRELRYQRVPSGTEP